MWTELLFIKCFPETNRYGYTSARLCETLRNSSLPFLME